MKFIIFFLISFPVFACTEIGPQDFKVKPETNIKCGKLAIQYAMDFARSQIAQEIKIKDYRGPKTLAPSATSPSVMYKQQKRTGNSRLIGFNVSLDSPDKFECNYCVDFSIDDKENCRIESIVKAMCAN